MLFSSDARMRFAHDIRYAAAADIDATRFFFSADCFYDAAHGSCRFRCYMPCHAASALLIC